MLHIVRVTKKQTRKGPFLIKKPTPLKVSPADTHKRLENVTDSAFGTWSSIGISTPVTDCTHVHLFGEHTVRVPHNPFPTLSPFRLYLVQQYMQCQFAETVTWIWYM